MEKETFQALLFIFLFCFCVQNVWMCTTETYFSHFCLYINLVQLHIEYAQNIFYFRGVEVRVCHVWKCVWVVCISSCCVHKKQLFLGVIMIIIARNACTSSFCLFIFLLRSSKYLTKERLIKILMKFTWKIMIN